MTEADEIYAGLIHQGRFNELLERFYRNEGENLFNLVLHTVGDYDLAQDVFQESFIRIHRCVRQLRTPGAYRFWAYRIAVNTSRNFLSRRQREYRIWDNSPDEDEIVDETALTPHDQLCHDSMQQSLLKALSQLSSEHRTALILYYYNDYKYDEIAAILSLPLNTVKSHIHRSKQQLARLLDRKKVTDEF